MLGSFPLYINGCSRWIVGVILGMCLYPSLPITAQPPEFRVVDSAVAEDLVERGWGWQYAKVACVNDQTCVAILERSDGMYSVALRKSTDGGESWSTALLQHDSVVAGVEWGNWGVRIHDFALMNAQEWLVVGDTMYGSYDLNFSPPRRIFRVHRFILRTSDGGNSWTTVRHGESLPAFKSISMYNDTFGIAVAYDSIFQTSDGGLTWNFLKYPPVMIGRIDHIYIDSPQDFRAFFYSGDEGENQMVSTSDGGETWTRQSISSPASWKNINLLSERLGWLATWDYGSDIFHRRNALEKTTDGGRTWQRKWEQEHTRPTGLIRVAFFDSDHGFAGGQGGQFMYTPDGGESWQLYDSLFIEDVVVRGEDPAVYGIAPLSPTSALIAFSTTRLVKYTSAPASAPENAQNQRSKTRLVLHGPSYDGTLRVRVVGSNRGELRLVDALGQLLQILDVPPTNIVTFDVAHLSNGTYFLVMAGNDGLVVERFIR